MNSENIPLTEALKKMTDEWVDDGNYCAQTVIDLRDALKKCLKDINDKDEYIYAKLAEYLNND
jgi:hypothetical protein